MMDEENQLDNPQTDLPTTDVEVLEDQDEASSNTSEAMGSELEDSSSTDQADSSVESTVASEDSSASTDQAASVAELTREIEALKAQLDDRTGQYMRIAADFDNFRKRTQKERQELELQAKCSTIVELLPVVDNFERARSHIKPQTEQEMTIHKSYQSVYKQLVECLKRIGVAPMRSEGQEFDPNMHEAVMRQPTEDYEEGTVMEELVRGYLLGERVLRHAMVKVAAAPEPMATSDQGNADEDAE